MKSIAIIIPFFGKWPEWIPLYFESIRRNLTVDWYFFTDCEVPDNSPENIYFNEITFQDYVKFVGDRLQINFKPSSPYKLCDLKPAYGYLHEDLIRNYDCFGFGDVDVIYGDIRKFYSDDVLSCNCISSHADRVAGHLTLFRNKKNLRQAFMKITKKKGRSTSGWKELYSHPEFLGLDEAEFSDLFLPPDVGVRWKWFLEWRGAFLRQNNYFVEQHSTILSALRPWHDGTWNFPETWFWKNGRLTNSHDGKREFMYLHFMNWKGERWLDRRYGDKAAWSGLPEINHVPTGEEAKGFRIDRSGFHPLENV